MDDHEHEFLRRTIEFRSASIANALREGLEDETALADREQLSSPGRNWVRGYLTSRLSMIRGSSTGNPNLSAEDLEAITALVDGNQKQIAAELYS